MADEGDIDVASSIQGKHVDSTSIPRTGQLCNWSSLVSFIRYYAEDLHLPEVSNSPIVRERSLHRLNRDDAFRNCPLKRIAIRVCLPRHRHSCSFEYYVGRHSSNHQGKLGIGIRNGFCTKSHSVQVIELNIYIAVGIKSRCRQNPRGRTPGKVKSWEEVKVLHPGGSRGLHPKLAEEREPIHPETVHTEATGR